MLRVCFCSARLLRSKFPPDVRMVAEELRRVETTRLGNRYRDDALYRDVMDRLGQDLSIGRGEVARLQSDAEEEGR